jgi:hypothetical protein
MTFEFTYDTEAEEIHIVYDNSIVLKASMENDKYAFQGFERVNDDQIESVLKTLCRQTFQIFT